MSRLNFDLQFESFGQNAFDASQVFNFTDDRFLGFSFNTSTGFTIPIPFLDDIDFGAFAAGAVGLQNTLNLNEGFVDAIIPIDLFLDLPNETIREGERVTIQTGFSLGTVESTNSLASFTTSSPQSSYDLDLIFDLATGIDVAGFNLEFDIDQTADLVSFDSSGSGVIFDTVLEGFTVSVPNLTTIGTETIPDSNQLVSSGVVEFVNGAIDIDSITTSLFSLPSLEGDVTIIDFEQNLPFPLPDIDLEAELEYNLLDIEAAISLSLIQAFSLNNITLPALLTLENGSTIPFNVGEAVEITVPEDVDQSLDMEVAVDFSALFRNETALGLDVDLDFLVGDFRFDANFLPDFSAGPLFQDSTDVFDTTIDVFSNTFNLAGFNREQVSFAVEVMTSLLGTSGDDVIIGTEANEFIDAMAGDDIVAGGLGDDEILGGDGDDVLRGDLNQSSPQAGLDGGDDFIRGGNGRDRIGGKAGNDTLWGEAGDDQIWGDDGDDLLRGGLGNDTLVGDDFSSGEGRDTFILAAGEGTDTIEDFEVGIDLIGLADGLTFGALTLSRDLQHTLIQLGDETLAQVQNVSTLSESDFVVL